VRVEQHPLAPLCRGRVSRRAIAAHGRANSTQLYFYNRSNHKAEQLRKNAATKASRSGPLSIYETRSQAKFRKQTGVVQRLSTDF